MKLLLALAATVGLSGCVGHKPDSPPAIEEPYVVDMDVGGNLNAYVRRYEELKASGQKVIIRSHATSASVIFAYLPNACLEPGALLRFHGPFNALTKTRMPWEVHKISDRLAPGAAKRYIEEWSFIPHDRLFDLNRKAAIKLDPTLKHCE